MYFGIAVNSLEIDDESFMDEDSSSHISINSSKYKKVWGKLINGEEVMLSFDEISELEDYVYTLSDVDNKIFDKRFRAIHDKRISCGISYKDHICSLSKINMKKDEVNYIN